MNFPSDEQTGLLPLSFFKHLIFDLKYYPRQLSIIGTFFKKIGINILIQLLRMSVIILLYVILHA